MKNNITHYTVNDPELVSRHYYYSRKLVPLDLLEKLNHFFRGAGIYYNDAFDETKSLFVHIPKAAGTSVSNALYGGRKGHHTAIAYRDADPCKFSSYYKFTIVRNPYDRLVSTYNYLLNSPHEEDLNWAKANIMKFKTFESFVKNWLNEENVMKWKHFIPQHFFVLDEDNKIIVDEIYKIETLQEDFCHISRKLGKDVELRHDNKSNHADYKLLYVDNEMIDIVKSVYRKDFETFGYVF